MTAKQIVSMALSLVGNNGGDRFWKEYGYANRVAWCCIFVWYVFKACGASMLFYDGKKTAYCPTLMNWGKSNGLSVTVSDAKPGDIVFFDWNANAIADHVGICVENMDSSIKTVDGNVNDEVQIITRDHSKVCWVIRPLYDAETESCADCPLRNALITLYNKLKGE